MKRQTRKKKLLLSLLVVGGLAAGAYFAPLLTLAIGLFVLSILTWTYKIWLWSYLTKYLKRQKQDENDQPGTPITTVRPQEAKLILRNEKPWRAITSSQETDPDDSWNVSDWDVPEAGKSPSKTKSRTEIQQAQLHPAALWLEKHILPEGMRWSGFGFMGNSVYWYNFRWSVLREDEPEDKEDSLVDKYKTPNGKWVAVFSKRINYVYLKDTVYFFQVADAETKGRLFEEKETATVGMPVTIGVLMTVRVVNVLKVLTYIHDWLQSIQDLIRPSLRFWVSTTFYEDIIAKPDVAQREFDVFLQQSGVTKKMLKGARNKKLIGADEQPKTFADYIELRYGVRIKRIGFEFVAPPEEYDKAARERAAAEQDKIRIETLARAEANRQRIISEGERDRIATVVAALKEGGSDALRIRELEALESVGENGNMVIVDGAKQQLLISPAGRAGKKEAEEKNDAS